MADVPPATDLAVHALRLRDTDHGPVVEYAVELVDIGGRPARQVAQLSPDEAELVAARLREEALRARLWAQIDRAGRAAEPGA
jgi:hypothetical protein